MVKQKEFLKVRRRVIERLVELAFELEKNGDYRGWWCLTERDDYTKQGAIQIMRDPARIKRILEKLAQVWPTTPDQRLGQLISNLRGLGPQDIFYWEDAELEAALDRQLTDEKA